MWPGGAAKVLPPGGRPGIKKSRCLPTATPFLRRNAGEDGLHGAFQAYENLRPFLWSHANNMPCIGIDRLLIAAVSIGQQFHGTGSVRLFRLYPRRDAAAYDCHAAAECGDNLRGGIEHGFAGVGMPRGRPKDDDVGGTSR